MTGIPLGKQPSTGIQRGRGGFLRSADDKPYVSDPSGATVKYDGNKPDLLKLCEDRGIEPPAKVTVAQLHELLGGRPKHIAYGSPSNRGKRIENTTNLVKWGERRVVLGMGLDAELVTMCQQLATLEVDSDDYKTTADGIIIRAKDVAKANLAAQRGTHVHALTEDFDESRDWVQRAEAGEIIGLDRATQDALVAGWHRMLERYGLQVLAVEASCVDDIWRLAGTLDRIVRTTIPLRFRLDGGVIVEIPASDVVVGDVKTSDKRLDHNGCVQYWQAYAIQIASYAQSVPYDTEDETRGVWPWEISQQHALIMHPDIETCEWELIYVDLVAGREHGGQCVVDADAWENRTDVFSVAQLDVVEDAPASVLDGNGVPVDGETCDVSRGIDQVASETSTGAMNSPATDDPPVAAIAEDRPSSANSQGDVDDFDAPMAMDSPAVSPSRDQVAATAGDGTVCTGAAPATSHDIDSDDFNAPMISNVTDIQGPGSTSRAGEGSTSRKPAAATETTPSSSVTAMGAPPCTPVDDDFDQPMVPTIAPGSQETAAPPAARTESLQWVKPAPVPAPELVIDRDEGSTVHLHLAFNEIETLYDTLRPTDRQWIKQLTEQAMHADVSFHAKGQRTERRFWIIKGVVMMCLSGLPEDEVLRALIAATTNNDTALFQSVKPGHALGALGATDAQTFAGLVDQMHTGRLVGAIDDDGAFVLRPVAA